MKKLLILSVLLLGSASVMAQAKVESSLSKQAMALKAAIEPMLSPVQADLQKLIDQIQKPENLPAFQGGVNNYQILLNNLKSENSNNPQVMNLINEAQASLDKIKGSVDDLSKIVDNIKNTKISIGNVDPDLKNIPDSFQNLDGFVTAIEESVPPAMCKNYNGQTLTGRIDSPSVSGGPWRFTDHSTAKAYLIDPHAGFSGTVNPWIPARSASETVMLGTFYFGGKNTTGVVCVNR